MTSRDESGDVLLVDVLDVQVVRCCAYVRHVGSFGLVLLYNNLVMNDRRWLAHTPGLSRCFGYILALIDHQVNEYEDQVVTGHMSDWMTAQLLAVKAGLESSYLTAVGRDHARASQVSCVVSGDSDAQFLVGLVCLAVLGTMQVSTNLLVSTLEWLRTVARGERKHCTAGVVLGAKLRSLANAVRLKRLRAMTRSFMLHTPLSV
jgi:hypothetical protein